MAMQEAPGDLERRFSEVYRGGLWGPDRSGPGSTVDATRSLRRRIVGVVTELFPAGSMLTLVDAACGDMAWMPLLLEELTEGHDLRLRYVGVEIVRELVERNARACSGTERIEMEFLHRDLTLEPPPRGDLVFCKDLINHLVFDDIWRVLDGFNRSASAFLLITSNEGRLNLDVERMEGNASRYINLEAAPFFLPRPLWCDGYLSLWRLPLCLEWPERAAGT